MAKKPSGREQLKAAESLNDEAPLTTDQAEVTAPAITLEEVNELQAEIEPAQPGIQIATIDLPLGTVPPRCYVSRHCDSGNLSNAQAITLRRLLEGLQETNARLANGRRVQTSPDVLRYLLDTIGAHEVSGDSQEIPT